MYYILFNIIYRGIVYLRESNIVYCRNTINLIKNKREYYHNNSL